VKVAIKNENENLVIVHQSSEIVIQASKNVIFNVNAL
jgi:hypothetical protein